MLWAFPGLTKKVIAAEVLFLKKDKEEVGKLRRGEKKL